MGSGSAQRAYLGTRKGLLQFDVDAAGAWQLALVQFAGDPSPCCCTMAATAPCTRP